MGTRSHDGNLTRSHLPVQVTNNVTGKDRLIVVGGDNFIENNVYFSDDCGRTFVSGRRCGRVAGHAFTVTPPPPPPIRLSRPPPASTVLLR